MRQQNSSSALRPAHADEPGCPHVWHDAFSAYLRQRFRLPHRQLPLGLTCDGCKKPFAAAEWQAHVLGCVNRPAPNATTAHQHIKVELRDLLRDVGISVESSEPSDYASVTCKGCNAQVPKADWTTHTTRCAQAAAGHTRGADIRLHIEDGAHVVDVTVIADEAPSYADKPLAQLDAARDLRKARLYGAQAASQGEKLHAIVLFTSGVVGQSTCTFANHVASRSRGKLTEKDILRTLRRAVAQGAGASLVAAERAAGVNHTEVLGAGAWSRRSCVCQ